MNHKQESSGMGAAKFFVPQSVVGDYPYAFVLPGFVMLAEVTTPPELPRDTRVRWSGAGETTRYFRAIRVETCDETFPHTDVVVEEELLTRDERLKRQKEIEIRMSELAKPPADRQPGTESVSDERLQNSDQWGEVELLHMERDDIARMLQQKA